MPCDRGTRVHVSDAANVALRATMVAIVDDRVGSMTNHKGIMTYDYGFGRLREALGDLVYQTYASYYRSGPVYWGFRRKRASPCSLVANNLMRLGVCRVTKGA